jgi:threonine dehydrogenase-like Zn-dependent dehydrogenase
MRAVVLEEGGRVAVSDVDPPRIEAPTDAIVRVTRAAICGSDLHILDGRAPGAVPGMSMGHELVGVVEAVGEDVTHVGPGERVVGSFLIPCRDCSACRRRRYEVCEDRSTPGAGMLLGDLGGAQAEQVRMPHADVTLLPVPDDLSDEQALFVGDILTTAYYANELGVVGPGALTVVQGCGPVGLLALQIAKGRRAEPLVAVDVDAGRLAQAEALGAIPIDASGSDPATALERLFGDGADVVIDTVGGSPRNLVQALDLVASGGRVAVVGVYTDLHAELPLAELFVNAVELRFAGFTPVPRLWHEALDLVASGAVDPTVIISHRLPLEDAATGYELFASREATKVVLEVG